MHFGMELQLFKSDTFSSNFFNLCEIFLYSNIKNILHCKIESNTLETIGYDIFFLLRQHTHTQKEQISEY